MEGIVLQKFLADSGVASRRASEDIIKKGSVEINGSIVTKLGTRVNPEKDIIKVDGEVLDRPKNLVYFLLNKPKGILSSASDDRGRKTVIDLIKTDTRVVPVGRLDIDTTGLLLLTNDGDLVNKLTHPKFEHEKEYEVVIQISQNWEKKNLENALSVMSKGVKISNDFTTSPSKARIIDQITNDRYLVSVVIREGHKHQVRQMIDAAGITVVGLRRIRMSILGLGDLKEGEYRELSEFEISKLKKSVE